jgi:DNA-binding FadR family transcriptional regulator
LKDRRLYPSRALHGQVAHKIGRRIAEGAIPAGALLPREAELAGQFGVSRQAIREALKVLAAKGLVASRRRTGTHVLPRSDWNLLDPDVLAWHPPERVPPDFLKDLIELRRLIEPAAAESAAARSSPEDVAAIGIALENMRRSVDDRDAFIGADVEFHVSIAGASGNLLFDRLSAMYAPLLTASFALQGQIRTRDMVQSDTLPRHTAVYEAISSRDPPAARTAMEALLASAFREVSAIPWDRLSGLADES